MMEVFQVVNICIWNYSASEKLVAMLYIPLNKQIRLKQLLQSLIIRARVENPEFSADTVEVAKSAFKKWLKCWKHCEEPAIVLCLAASPLKVKIAAAPRVSLLGPMLWWVLHYWTSV